jgi:hypothetical protein
MYRFGLPPLWRAGFYSQKSKIPTAIKKYWLINLSALPAPKIKAATKAAFIHPGKTAKLRATRLATLLSQPKSLQPECRHLVVEAARQILQVFSPAFALTGFGSRTIGHFFNRGDIG